MKFAPQPSLGACQILYLFPSPWAPEFHETAELDLEEPERCYLDHFSNVVGAVVTQVH
jgi:hypothetical protein